MLLLLRGFFIKNCEFSYKWQIGIVFCRGLVGGAEDITMPTAGNILQWIVVALLCVGVIMVNSAGMTVESESLTLKGLLFGRTTAYAVIAILVMLILGHLDIRQLQSARGFGNPIFWIMLISVVFCVLVLIPGIGTKIHESRRWLHLGPRSTGLTFQPSELAKWCMVVVLAWWCARHASGMRRFRDGLLPALMIVGLVCGLIIVEDLGTAVLIGVVAGVMLIAGGARVWHLCVMIVPSVCAVGGLIWSSPYRMNRMLAFLNPYADPQGIGYHPIQSMVAIFMGTRGIGNGVEEDKL